MIDNEATFGKFGYYADDLKPKSGKRIVVICDKCGKVREVYKFAYHDLCKSCSCKGRKHTEESCKKISKNHADVKGKNGSFYGKHHTLETKIKMSKSQMGIHHTKESRKKLSEAHKGKKVSNETKQKMSNARKGNKHWAYGKTGELSPIFGNKNPAWKGGISFKPYCSKFNNQIKQQIRNNYNNCDYISGLSNYICNNEKNLDVHHIDYNKNQGCDGNKWKLIPLSRSNHTKTNFNRSFWNRLFIYSLQCEEEYYTDNKVNIWEMI